MVRLIPQMTKTAVSGAMFWELAADLRGKELPATCNRSKTDKDEDQRETGEGSVFEFSD